MPELTLYYFPTCPYCRKVLSYLEASGIDIPKKNVRESKENYEELLDIAQDTQVPCLVIDGKPLHESDDIIKWLEKNYKNSV